MATKIGIVYATASGILRRWIVPDADAELSSHPVSPGESMLIVEASEIKSPADVEAAVAKKIGRLVPSARCAVVDKLGRVVDVIMADPALDAIPGLDLVLHSDVEVGWSMVGGVLLDTTISVDVVDA